VLIGKQGAAVILYGDSSENTVKFNTIGGAYFGVQIIDGPHDNMISGNKIGNNGTLALDNGLGVAIEYAENNRIEKEAPTARRGSSSENPRAACQATRQATAFPEISSG